MHRRLAAVMAAAVFCGCANDIWTKQSGFTDAEWRETWTYCNARSSFGSGDYNTTGQAIVGGLILQQFAKRRFRKCMRGEGWEIVEQPDEDTANSSSTTESLTALPAGEKSYPDTQTQLAAAVHAAPPTVDSIGIEKHTEMAKQGDADAQFMLARAYYLGEGVPQDYTEAVKWLRKAAEQGHADSQYNLGGMYYLGKGVPQDYTEAAKWLRIAAEQGNADSQYNLGVMYGDGVGVPQDYVRALAWYNIAGANGSEIAAGNRAELAADMTAEQITAAQKLAAEYFEKHKAEKSNP